MEIIKALGKIAATLVSGVICFILGKLLFVVLNGGIYEGVDVSDVMAAIGHGFTMDLSMSAYLTIIPAIIIWVSIFRGSRGAPVKILRGYFAVICAVISAVVLIDAVLYGYWRFKLDSTPIFYFLSSPSAAFASAEWWMFPLALIGWAVTGIVFYKIYSYLVLRAIPPVKRCRSAKEKIGGSVLMILAFGGLFISIRGGVTVSTMNLSRAYFSDDARLNHAAINPAFSLMYSLTHQDRFDRQFRYFTPEENARIFAGLYERHEADSVGVHSADSVMPLLRKGSRPDVYLLILESFSTHLFPSAGGEPIALKLDSIAGEGLVFTNFYANSFRTDRGLAAILSGYPGQPNTSIMKYVSKTENLPSWGGSMKRKGGYATEYYYGGDANFTNMRAYLVNAGFDKIVSDVDFPIGERLSKWGAHDDVLFKRVERELTPYDSLHPKLRVIQTSSSHEPFEVPYDDKGRFSDQRARAFAYTDSCAASFVELLSKDSRWDNSLVVIVPDHYGAYPDLDDPLQRHRIPLIVTGGALERRGECDTYGSQIDIAATLLGALGIGHEEFLFSKDLLDPGAPHFGVFADPSVAGIISENDTTIFNTESGQQLDGYGNRRTPEAKAFLQTLYDDLSKR